MATLNQFCRQFSLIFVEEWQERGKPSYTFLDYHGKRRTYTDDQIFRMLSH